MNHDNAMLDDVAVYALGALPQTEAAAVRAHVATCAQCQQEYRRLKPAVDAVALSAEACADRAAGAVVPSARLKAKVMNAIRPQAVPPLGNVGEMRAVRPIVWPAYAVAAACLVIALITSVVNISLNEELHQSQVQLAQFNARARLLNRQIALQRTELADLTSSDSQHYAVEGGEVVRHGNRLYIAMQTMPMPPRGKVYQAWIMKSGADRMAPSVTFMPDRGGIAVLPIPGPASNVVEVAVSMEPEGGSKQPTTKPEFVVKLT